MESLFCSPFFIAESMVRVTLLLVFVVMALASEGKIRFNRDLLRWPNTVFGHAFADTIQRGHKDCKKTHAINRASDHFIYLRHALCVLTFLRN